MGASANNTISRKTFIRAIHGCLSETYGFRQSGILATDIVASLISILRSRLLSGQAVRLPKMGTLRVVNKAARPGRNPKTGEVHTIPARTTVSFSKQSSNNATVTPEIMATLRSDYGLSEAVAREVFNTFWGVFQELSPDRPIQLRHFGSMTRTLSFRSVRNPATGEQLGNREIFYTTFKPAQTLLADLNENR